MHLCLYLYICICVFVLVFEYLYLYLYLCVLQEDEDDHDPAVKGTTLFDGLGGKEGIKPFALFHNKQDWTQRKYR